MKRMIISVVAAAVALGIVGCGPTPVEEKAEEESAPQYVAPVRTGPLALPEPGAFAAGTISGVTTESGYTFDAIITVANQPATTAITNAAPGTTDLAWTATYSGLMTNTTVGRVIPPGQAGGYIVVGLWPEGSVVCDLELGRDLGGIQTADVFDIGGGRYCSLPSSETVGNSTEIAADGLATFTGALNFAANLTEAEAPGVAEALSAGPVSWAFASNAPYSDGPCTMTLAGWGRTHGVWWLSNPDLGCVNPNSTALQVAGSIDSAQLGVATDVADRATMQIAEIEPLEASMSSCPFSAMSAQLYGGLAAESYQRGQWDGLNGFRALEKDDLHWPTMACQDGGMRLSVAAIGEETDAETYLANKLDYAEWLDMSDSLPMLGGTAVATATTITPVEGDPYDVARVAWYTDALLIEATLVRATPQAGIAWLNVNLPSIIANLSTWDGQVIEG